MAELVDFWIDRHLSFLRRRTYRHYRRFLGPWMTRHEWQKTAPERRARSLREIARPKYVRRLLREWRAMKVAIRAVSRGETMVFEIGKPFLLSERVWICTDVGARTICAVLLDELDASHDRGPPYSIVEHVLDAYAMDGCEPATDATTFRSSIATNAPT